MRTLGAFADPAPPCLIAAADVSALFLKAVELLVAPTEPKAPPAGEGIRDSFSVHEKEESSSKCC